MKHGLKQGMFLFLLLLTPISWAHHVHFTPVQWIPLTMAESFDRIHCSGPVRVALSARTTGQKAWVHAKNRRAARIYTAGHTLYITTDLPATTPLQDRPTVRLQISQLAALEVSGATTVSAQHLKNIPPFTVVHSSREKTRLTGELPIKKIIQKGTGILDIAWVKSHTLQVDADKGIVRLAGKVRHLYARVHNTAILDAKHLRAQHVWIQTQQAGKADIMALNTLNAFAQNHSEIHYYKRPHLDVVINTYNSGNVMQVQSWN